MRLPQSVKRSISRRVLCFGWEDSWVSSSSSAGNGFDCSVSEVEAGGESAGLEELSLVGLGNRSVLGAGWLVTEEDDSGEWLGVAAMCSTTASAVKRENRYIPLKMLLCPNYSSINKHMSSFKARSSYNLYSIMLIDKSKFRAHITVGKLNHTELVKQWESADFCQAAHFSTFMLSSLLD